MTHNELVPVDQPDQANPSAWDKTRDFVQQHKGKILLGAAAVSLAMPFAVNPAEEAAEQVGGAIGWTIAGGAVSEGMFCGGIAMMGASMGAGRAGLGKNPLKWRLPEVCERANDSLLFKTGFWVNTTGAVGTAAIGAAAAIAYLPPGSLGILAVPAFDLAVTYKLRRALLDGIKDNAPFK